MSTSDGWRRKFGAATSRCRAACWLVCLLGPAALGQPAWFSPEWAKIRERMGPIDFDGRLAMSLPVHRIEAEGVRDDISLVHQVDIDADDVPMSRWVLSGLTSYLVPENRNSVKALLPGGRILHFTRKTKGSDPIRDTTGNWQLSEKDQQSMIQSPLGNCYFFARGQLAEILTDRGVALGTVSEAGHIRSIARRDDPAHPIVSCDYDSVWEPVIIKFGGAEIAEFKWNDGLLLEWDSGGARKERFNYRNRMVVQVASPNQAATEIEWGPVSNWERTTHLWLAPLRVTRINHLSFAYDLGHDGAVYLTTEASTGLTTVTKFNWFADIISQQIGDGVPEIVKYSPALVPPGYFVRIGPLGGNPLEEYTYGTDKRLTKIRRRSPDGSEIQIAGPKQIVDGWDGESQSGFPDYER